MWQTKQPLSLWTQGEATAASGNEHEEGEQESEPKKVRLYIPGKLHAITGAGERRPGSSGWARGGGNERLRGCRARILFKSLATFFGMKLAYEES